MKTLLRACLPALVLLAGCPLPGPQDNTYNCSSTGDCAADWTCDMPAGAAQGTCRKTCGGDGDCPSNAPVCSAGMCMTGTGGASSSTGGSSQGGSGGSSGVSGSSGSIGSSSGGSVGSSGGSGSSGSSSSGGSSGPRATVDLVTTTGGGGTAANATYKLQMCIGQPVMGSVTVGQQKRLSMGLMSTVEAP